jgi:predicted Zn-dependent protease
MEADGRLTAAGRTKAARQDLGSRRGAIDKRVLLGLLAIVFLGFVVFYLLVLPGGSVYLMALGPTSREHLETLAAHALARCGITVHILDEVPLQGPVMDPVRRQLIADELLALMKWAHPVLAWNPRAVLIGVTPYDMYTRARPEWAFVFNLHHLESAVLSLTRLDPVNLGMPADEALFKQRLRKTFMRDIGYLVSRKLDSSDPRSVMFAPLGGVDDLDRMDEDFWQGPCERVDIGKK